MFTSCAQLEISLFLNRFKLILKLEKLKNVLQPGHKVRPRMPLSEDLGRSRERLPTETF